MLQVVVRRYARLAYTEQATAGTALSGTAQRGNRTRLRTYAIRQGA